jgi:hypothetical protein
MRAGTVAGLWNSICMRAPCIAFRVCNECIHFISRFHDLTFGHARTCAIIHGWPAIRELATHFFIFCFGKAAHMQQRHKTKHFI